MWPVRITNDDQKSDKAERGDETALMDSNFSSKSSHYFKAEEVS